ncbi:FAD/NAD(P)-binding protein [Pseudoduganella danionis]|uniref:FAD/NAD(P)-binding protein n=1 Tax=Pseudoduganella danionis TaxID=1890295 RepID=UPI0035B0819B
MQRYSVAIIGMGPRGLSVLERLAALCGHTGLALDITVIEPGPCGAGVHDPEQSRHLLINTLASQVTLFPLAGSVRYATVCSAPSLTDWARQQGYRRYDDGGYAMHGDSGHAAGSSISDGDYLPRGLLGAYLCWAYAQLAAALPACATLRRHRASACDLALQADGQWAITLDSGAVVHSRFVFLTTGHDRQQPDPEQEQLEGFVRQHGARNPQLALVRELYPSTQLQQIAAGTQVAIQGLGLCAHDVLAELTLGRGGRYLPQPPSHGAGLRYLPSGAEPRLTLCSRLCLPAAARGLNQKGLAGRHAAQYFTPQALAALRARAQLRDGSPQLDFERDVLPLLQREMAWVYRSTLAGHALDPQRFVLTAGDAAQIMRWLFPLQQRRFATLGQFRHYVHDWLLRDLAAAQQGNLGNACKAALDVLRDCRATLQAALEFGGLTPASHRQFLQRYHPAINRMAYGPPLRRNQQLLALMEAGVVQWLAGPGCHIETDAASARFQLCTPLASGWVRQGVDVLVVARLAGFFPFQTTSLLIRNMLAQGLARPYQNGDFHPGGLDIDGASQLLDRQGQVSPRLWALGFPVEGAHYYTHALPRPGLVSRVVQDAERCVLAMAQQLLPQHQYGAVCNAG